MVRQSGLGRGLASLIPQKKKNIVNDTNYFGSKSEDETIVDLASKTVIENSPIRAEKAKKEVEEKIYSGLGDVSLRSIVEVSVDLIVANPFQPRKHFSEEKLQELAESIKLHGVIQPLVVSRADDDRYELIAGERRLEASKIAGLEKVPVIIKDVKDQEKLELALIENIQRHNLNIIEEARSFRQLQDQFNLTQDEIAKRVGKSRSAVANVLRLLNLPFEIQRALQESRISEGHARSILAVSNPEKQRALFELILKENLNVRQLEAKVREISVSSHQRRFRDIDPEIRQQEERLSLALGTKVKIKKSSKGSQITIDCYSSEEFDSLYSKLASLD